METKNTSASSAQVCQNCKQQFEITYTDKVFYKKMQVPSPTFCPDCRLQRRLAFRNERALYKRSCDLCNNDVISLYHKESPYIVYCQKCWWSDEWDPLEYGQEHDFNRPFFEQFDELLKKVPLMASFVVDQSRMVNSPYNNMVTALKNCYLLTDADYNEECAYGCEIEKSKSCIDTNLVDSSELCYEVVNCQNCYRTCFSVDCDQCQNVWLSRDMVGCQDCFGCVGLRNKQYYIFNEPYSKEDFEIKMQELSVATTDKLQEVLQKSHELWLRYPVKYMHERHNTNVSGDYIYNSKNTINSWIVQGGEDVRYSHYLVAPGSKDAYDYTQYGDGAELIYDVLQCGNGISNVKFGWFNLTKSRNVEYSIQVMNTEDVFGCIALRKKQYCILNKQYTKEEYEELLPKIKEHMNTQPFIDRKGRSCLYGEFFPVDISPFAYNESTAQQFFMRSQQEAEKEGFVWKEQDLKGVAVTMGQEDVPKNITDVNENILTEVIECAHKGTCNEQCTVGFRIIPQELTLLKQLRIALPQLCPNCRHYQRLEKRNPPQTWQRACQCAGQYSEGEKYTNKAEHFHDTDPCSNEFQTSYAPERPEIVYCEQCYQQEII